MFGSKREKELLDTKAFEKVMCGIKKLQKEKEELEGDMRVLMREYVPEVLLWRSTFGCTDIGATMINVREAIAEKWRLKELERDLKALGYEKKKTRGKKK